MNAAKTLLIGCGSSGLRHRRVLESLGCQVDVVTRRTDLPGPCHPRLEGVDLQAYDYFVIASETTLHHQQLNWISTRVRGRTILVEKPLFHRHLDSVLTDNRVFVAYQLRFHPVLRRLSELLGRVLAVQVQVGQYLPDWRPDRDYRTSYSARAEGGGVLLDLSHELDYTQWLFGRLQPGFAFCGRVSDLEIASDDYLVLHAVTPAGAPVTLQMDYLSRIPYRRIIVHQVSSTIVADLMEGRVSLKNDTDAGLQTFDLGEARDLCYQRMHAEAIAGGGKTLCTFDEGAETMRLIEKIRELGHGH